MTMKGAKEGKKKCKTYNTGDSPVVTDLSTNPALSGLSMGERTGSRIFHWVWSYVLGTSNWPVDIPRGTETQHCHEAYRC